MCEIFHEQATRLALTSAYNEFAVALFASEARIDQVFGQINYTQNQRNDYLPKNQAPITISRTALIQNFLKDTGTPPRKLHILIKTTKI